MFFLLVMPLFDDMGPMTVQCSPIGCLCLSSILGIIVLFLALLCRPCDQRATSEELRGSLKFSKAVWRLQYINWWSGDGESR